LLPQQPVYYPPVQQQAIETRLTKAVWIKLFDDIKGKVIENALRSHIAIKKWCGKLVDVI
jgi:hypothetical protein